jgi:hypothetical protein
MVHGFWTQSCSTRSQTCIRRSNHHVTSGKWEFPSKRYRHSEAMVNGRRSCFPAYKTREGGQGVPKFSRRSLPTPSPPTGNLPSLVGMASDESEKPVPLPRACTSKARTPASIRERQRFSSYLYMYLPAQKIHLSSHPVPLFTKVSTSDDLRGLRVVHMQMSRKWHGYRCKYQLSTEMRSMCLSMVEKTVRNAYRIYHHQACTEHKRFTTPASSFHASTELVHSILIALGVRAAQ